MRGRKPKPTALKEIEGNPGKRKLNREEPKSEVGAPAKPAHLTEEASAIWDETVPILLELNTLTVSDGHALEVYCEALAMYRIAIAQVKQFGIVVDGPQGVKKNPAVTVSTEKEKTVRAFESEFGLTPSARTRIKQGGGEEDDASPLEKLIREQNGQAQATRGKAPKAEGGARLLKFA